MSKESLSRFERGKRLIKRGVQTSLLAASVATTGVISERDTVTQYINYYDLQRVAETEDVDSAIVTSRSEKEKKSFFDQLIIPLCREALLKREERAGNDSDFSKRVDTELNQGRVNFLLYGYGETHEPPRTERAFIGSITVASIDVSSGTVALISFTHDIRAPEIERYQKAKGNFEGYLIKIDKAYPLGGFDLMRETVEDATGLSIDYQIAFRESKIAELVDRVFEGVDVEVVRDFDAAPFYLDGVKHTASHFNKGKQEMDGITVLEFIKTVPIPKPPATTYPAELEHKRRMEKVFRGMAEEFSENKFNPVFLIRLNNYFNSGNNAEINFDFDVKSLIQSNFSDLMTSAVTSIFSDEEPLPEINRSVYIVYGAHGDGGVQWVTLDQNPITRAQIRAGVYPDLSTEIPYNANPDGDLVTEYWPSVRKLIRDRLTGN